MYTYYLGTIYKRIHVESVPITIPDSQVVPIRIPLRNMTLQVRVLLAVFNINNMQHDNDDVYSFGHKFHTNNDFPTFSRCLQPKA